MTKPNLKKKSYMHQGSVIVFLTWTIILVGTTANFLKGDPEKSNFNINTDSETEKDQNQSSIDQLKPQGVNVNSTRVRVETHIQLSEPPLPPGPSKFDIVVTSGMVVLFIWNFIKMWPGYLF